MRLSRDGIEHMKGWEKCELKPYLDSAGKMTCGWGHVILPGDPPTPWTQATADSIYVEDIRKREVAVDNMLAGIPLMQNDYDALVDFAFHKGIEALKGSSLLRLLKRGARSAAAAEFTRWDKAKGRLNLGVLRRSCSEQAMFLAADYSRRP